MSEPSTGYKLVVLAIIVAVGLFGAIMVYLFTGATKAGNVPALCSDNAKETEQAVKLVHEGIDEALVDHTRLLMGIWIKDDVNESRRAAVGIQNGVRAYFHAQRQIEAWDIPLCK